MYTYTHCTNHPPTPQNPCHFIKTNKSVSLFELHFHSHIFTATHTANLTQSIGFFLTDHTDRKFLNTHAGVFILTNNTSNIPLVFQVTLNSESQVWFVSGAQLVLYYFTPWKTHWHGCVQLTLEQRIQLQYHRKFHQLLIFCFDLFLLEFSPGFVLCWEE